MTTRIIRITECAQCPHAAKLTHAQTGELSAWWCQSVMSRTGPVAFGEPICPPEGTPEWCPLERLEKQQQLAAMLIRTIVAEAERTGSWELPGDVKEWMVAFVAERDRGKRRIIAAEGGLSHERD